MINFNPNQGNPVNQRNQLIQNIQNQFGSKKLKTFPHFKWTDWYYYHGVKKIKVI